MKVDISTRIRVDLIQAIDPEKTTDFGLIGFRTVEKRVLVMTAKYSYKDQDYEEEIELEEAFQPGSIHKEKTVQKMSFEERMEALIQAQTQQD